MSLPRHVALFGPAKASDAGLLLGSASSPLPYVAGLTTLAFISNGVSVADVNRAAVRIIADTVSVDEPLLLALVAAASP